MVTGVDHELTARAVASDEFEDIARRLTGGPHAQVTARLRTRDLTTLARVSGDEFELLIPSASGVRLISGPAERLGGEFVGLITTLERTTGTTPPDEPPPTVDIPPLAPGELLALAEVIREGDPERLGAALEELEMAGLPWWIRQFAWGAEAVLTLQLSAASLGGFATMLHLLPDGWGCLRVDNDDDLTFRPMTTVQVQARISAFAALLQECSP